MEIDIKNKIANLRIFLSFANDKHHDNEPLSSIYIQFNGFEINF